MKHSWYALIGIGTLWASHLMVITLFIISTFTPAQTVTIATNMYKEHWIELIIMLGFLPGGWIVTTQWLKHISGQSSASSV